MVIGPDPGDDEVIEGELLDDVDPAAPPVEVSVESLVADMRRLGPGGLYLNFAGFGEEKEALVRSSYGENYDRLVELNVMEQCINIIKIDHVQRAVYKTGYPTVHGWVFDVRTGKLIDLGLNMQEVFGQVRSIYDLNPIK